MDEETERLAYLNKQLKSIDTEMHNRRKNLGGASGVEEKKAKLAAQIRTLENRVEQATKRFNDTLTQNGRLREKIDHLKQERRVFDGLNRKLDQEMLDYKTQMAAVIAQSRQVSVL